jgi:hypothetical protein
MRVNPAWFTFILVVLTACSVPQGPTRVDTSAAGSFPDLSGPYLGQEPPGLEPQLFAPGIVSTGLSTRDVAMTPDGEELYFSVVVGQKPAIMVTRQVDGRWSEPRVAPFSGRHMDIEPCITSDGRRFFFLSNRPGPDRPEKPGWAYQDIWVMDRTDGGWGEPYPLGPPINTDAPEYFPSVTADGTIYFTREGEDGRSSIHRSRLVDGAYQEPERLGPEVNCGMASFNAFIAPDESFIIVPVLGREDSLGGVDYYVVFRSPDDRWSEPINLGEQINQSEGREWSPYVSPDGRFLFFMSSRTTGSADTSLTGMTIEELVTLAARPGVGSSDIWWVSAEVVRHLKPNGF